ncbi:hypothetical protein GH714_005312 [Hevea brasiliensis]|uniref:Uncharacterized protein n=1 Tax=Hevea brasiliensis TaxID=3981 RepID=A0A6A6KBM8_HEVBR|nr:hypothetical protein GH714_005312 [Hevea brasiliensis]
MCVLTLSVSLQPLRPPPCKDTNVENCQKASALQLAVFFGALYTLAVGTGGTKPNISTIGADQFDDFHPKEKGQKLSFFNWHRKPTGSPFTRMARVIVAALRKWKVTIPNDPKELYEHDLEEFLNKAAVKTGSSDPWMLCTVTQVEETKQMLRMIPILITTFVPSTMIAQINTLFVKQGTTLDRHIGSFKIPPASLAGFVTLAMLISVVLYDRYFVRIMRRWTNNPRGITLLQRMGIGMCFHIIIMITASRIESHRLSVAKKHGLVESGGQIPLTIFILLPQFVLMGMADAFLEVAKLEFFYDQAPESMKSLGTSYSTTSLGVGNFLSSFLLSTVARITKNQGHHHGWILNNLNASHLDYYYAFFAILNFLNLIFFFVVIKFYVYKAEVSDSMEVLAEELKGMRLKAPSQEVLNGTS